MEQGFEVLLSEFNDPDLKHDRSPLSNLRFLEEGQTLIRKLSALRRDFPEEFVVQHIIVSEDGEVLGARSREAMELTLSELKRDYGLILPQEPPLDLPEAFTVLPGLSSEARTALLRKVEAGKTLDSLDQKCLQGCGWTGGFNKEDHAEILKHLKGISVPEKPSEGPAKAAEKELPVQKLSPEQQENILRKLDSNVPLSTADIIFLTLAGIKYQKTPAGNKILREELLKMHTTLAPEVPSHVDVERFAPGKLALGW